MGGVGLAEPEGDVTARVGVDGEIDFLGLPAADTAFAPHGIHRHKGQRVRRIRHHPHHHARDVLLGGLEIERHRDILHRPDAVQGGQNKERRVGVHQHEHHRLVGVARAAAVDDGIVAAVSLVVLLRNLGPAGGDRGEVAGIALKIFQHWEGQHAVGVRGGGLARREGEHHVRTVVMVAVGPFGNGIHHHGEGDLCSVLHPVPAIVDRPVVDVNLCLTVAHTRVGVAGFAFHQDNQVAAAVRERLREDELFPVVVPLDVAAEGVIHQRGGAHHGAPCLRQIDGRIGGLQQVDLDPFVTVIDRIIAVCDVIRQGFYISCRMVDFIAEIQRGRQVVAVSTRQRRMDGCRCATADGVGSGRLGA